MHDQESGKHWGLWKQFVVHGSWQYIMLFHFPDRKIYRKSFDNPGIPSYRYIIIIPGEPKIMARSLV